MILWRVADAAVAVAEAEAEEEPAQEAAHRAVVAPAHSAAAVAERARRQAAHLPCRAHRHGPQRAGQVRGQPVAHGPADRHARRWATCRRLAHGPVLHVPAELDLARAADRATSPIARAELAPAHDLAPAVDRAAASPTAVDPARHVLAVVGHRLATLETSSIWVEPAALLPACGQAWRRPAARSREARRHLSCKKMPDRHVRPHDRVRAGDRAPAIWRVIPVRVRAAEFNGRQRDPDKVASQFNGLQHDPVKTVAEFNVLGRALAKMAVEFNDQLHDQAKTAVESSARHDLDRTAAAFDRIVPCDQTEMATFDRIEGQARTAAGNAGIAKTGPIIGPIESPIAINGTIGARITAMTFATTGTTTGATTIIGSTTIGGTITTIPISIGPTMLIGGVGQPSARSRRGCPGDGTNPCITTTATMCITRTTRCTTATSR